MQIAGETLVRIPRLALVDAIHEADFEYGTARYMCAVRADDPFCVAGWERQAAAYAAVLDRARLALALTLEDDQWVDIPAELYKEVRLMLAAVFRNVHEDLKDELTFKRPSKKYLRRLLARQYHVGQLQTDIDST